ncbi:hypothetical protein [Streptomyces sp. S1D4-20]|uniref:hypothetical protein n=1 Tax=Streptomyces sp. S1D4-20 TaxID=2594462 RepID=UPI001164FC63|nr:hypothetical protein [Streptomyces sp. S1D4-20]QDN54043.1 hypothetical protein FNV67_00235 [Streptomyces sp. S1D4-20]
MSATGGLDPADPDVGLPPPTADEIAEVAAYLRQRLTAAASEQTDSPATGALLRAVGTFVTSRMGYAHGLGRSPLVREAAAPLYELAAQFPDCPLHWRRRAEEWMSGGAW